MSAFGGIADIEPKCFNFRSRERQLSPQKSPLLSPICQQQSWPREGVPQPCQDNAASAPSWRPQRPKRKPGIADLIGVGPNSLAFGPSFPESPGRKTPGQDSSDQMGIFAPMTAPSVAIATVAALLQFWACRAITAEAVAEAPSWIQYGNA